jgi:hypothetical protein
MTTFREEVDSMAKVVRRRVPKQGDRPPQRPAAMPANSKGDNRPIVRRRHKGSK